MSKNEFFIKGLDKVNQNDFESAIELFSKALETENDKADIYYNRAVAYLNLEQTDLAVFDFSKLIEIDSKNAFYYSCRGFAKARTSDKQGAIADYEKSLELDPDNPITYNNMGLVQEQMGYMTKSQRSFEKSDVLRKSEDTAAPQKQASNGKIEKEVEDRLNKVSKERLEELPNKVKTDKKKSTIAKDVFTKKSTFKEFIAFIKNGFKIK
jgi:Flp pilus assembly protein TadD